MTSNDNAPPVLPASTDQTTMPPVSAASEGAPCSLPKLPVPKLQDTLKRYLRALEGLQDEDEHARTKSVVQDFLSSGEGERWQRRLEEYNKGVDSYIEEFWCE
jgi:carnitine O-acetyltransferase